MLNVRTASPRRPCPAPAATCSAWLLCLSLACSPNITAKPGANPGEDAGATADLGQLGEAGNDDSAEQAICAEDVYRPDPLPIDVFLVVDSSATMGLALQGDMTTTKWRAVQAAVSDFIVDPKSKGLGVGIQYF